MCVLLSSHTIQHTDHVEHYHNLHIVSCRLVFKKNMYLFWKFREETASFTLNSLRVL